MGIEYKREEVGFSQVQKYRDLLAEHRFSLLMVLPTLFFLVFILWIPFIRGIWMSFHEWPFIGDPEWVGLGHYKYLFNWKPFFTSLEATAVFWTATIVQLGVALLAALLVKNASRFKSIISGGYLLPYTMPPVVTGTLWMYHLNPTLGPVSKYLVNNGIIDQPIYWNVDGDLALAVITLVAAWTFWPFMFLLIYASLENIPAEHYETGRVYGANRFQAFWYITLPQIKSAIIVAVAIRTVWNLTKISQAIQLTGGGPGYDTSILAVLMYNFAYLDARMGISYAAGMVLLAISIAFVLIFIRELNKERGVGH